MTSKINVLANLYSKIKVLANLLQDRRPKVKDLLSNAKLPMRDVSPKIYSVTNFVEYGKPLINLFFNLKKP